MFPCTPKPTVSRCTVQTPIGWLLLAADHEALLQIKRVEEPLPPQKENPGNPLLHRARIELLEYFSGARQIFDLPIAAQGSSFEAGVWRQLQKIPFGSVVSYGDIARLCDHPKAFRAVGQACNHNPILIMIPCHRVVGQNGKLTGFGCGIEIKKQLLAREGVDSAGLPSYFAHRKQEKKQLSFVYP